MSHSNVNDHDTNPPNNTNYSHNSNSFINYFSNNIVWNVNNTAAMDERSKILAWLSPLEPRIRHQDLRTRRADNIGEWLLHTDEFQSWCNGADHATLFCYGDPAVGKTYFK